MKLEIKSLAFNATQFKSAIDQIDTNNMLVAVGHKGASTHERIQALTDPLRIVAKVTDLVPTQHGRFGACIASVLVEPIGLRDTIASYNEQGISYTVEPVLAANRLVGLYLYFNI